MKGGNEKYMGMIKGKKGKGVMGHEKQPMPCKAFDHSGTSKVMNKPMEKKGYPQKAFEYKY